MVLELVDRFTQRVHRVEYAVADRGDRPERCLVVHGVPSLLERHDILLRLVDQRGDPVEFGLIGKPGDMKIYGAGIVSSYAESVFSLEARSPNRIAFDIPRIMRTQYRYDDFQQTYFVIESFEQLLEETQKDFESIYNALKGQDDISARAVIDSDTVYQEGTQEYADAGGRWENAPQV